MKLYSRKFVRGLRRRVRRAVKASPASRKTARRIRFSRLRQPVGAAGIRWLAPWLIVLIALPTAGEAPTLWLSLIVWTLVISLLRAHQLREMLWGSARPFAFIQWPVTSRQVWSHIAGRVLRTSWWLLLDGAVVVWFACFSSHVPPAAWFGLAPAAVLVWASAMAMGIVLSWKFPRVPYARFAFVVGGAGFLGALLFQKDQLTAQHLRDIHGFLLWATPQGWACQVIEWLAGARASFPAAALGLIALLCAFAVPCYRALADRYVFWELDLPPAAIPPDAESDAAEFDDADSAPAAVSKRADFEAVETVIRAGEYLLPRTRSGADWLDRMLLPRAGRDETVTDFLLGRAFSWGVQYRNGALLILVAPLLAGLARFLGATVAFWVLGLALFIGLGMTTPLFGGQWVGFALGPFRPRHIAVLALLPVGLREIRRVVLGVNARRFFAALPCWLLAGVWGAYDFEQTPLQGLRVAVCVWLVLLLLQPFFLVFKYSQGTNDSSGCIPALLFAFLAIWPVLATVGAGIATLSPLAWPWQVGSLVAVALTSYGFEAGYRRLYCAQRFDLVTKAREETV